MTANEQLNGLLPVLKPKDMVSKDVSRFLQKQFGVKKLGHVGTLDPMASGVLPVLLGRATKFQDHLLEMPKAYEFVITFGSETDTLDSCGEVIKTADFDASYLDQDVVGILDSFVGEIEQIPPIYSAVKYRGKPLYRYARSGQIDQVPLGDLRRRVTIDEFKEVSRGEDWIRLSLRCSKGTYVRVLAQEFAQKIGTVGTVTEIVRTEAAGLRVVDAVDFKRLADCDDLRQLVQPIEKVYHQAPKWRVQSFPWAQKLRNGQKLLVHSDHFMKCLSANHSTFGGEETNKLFILDDLGNALGLGEACWLKSESCFQVKVVKGV